MVLCHSRTQRNMIVNFFNKGICSHFSYCKNLPTIPNISVHGLPAKMFISIGCIREVRVQSLTVESRELEARINGLDEWQVKPEMEK